jgi:hypothetical protein
VIAAIGLAASILTPVSAAQEAKRMALVIGNNDDSVNAPNAMFSRHKTPAPFHMTQSPI